MNVGIICPGYPDTPGGVTDHTKRLVRHWSDAGRKVQVLGSTTADPDAVLGDWAREGVGALLIQYVPFLYARRGLSVFPRQVATAARRLGLRTTLFVHEPWVPPTRLPWLALSPLQRRQLWHLVKLCDVVVTPVPAWRQMLGPNAFVMYVGSTLGDRDYRTSSGAEILAPVVFSPFASGLNWDWIVAAARSLAARPGLTVIGTDWETARRHPVLKRWADATWDWRGHPEAPNILALLAGARLVLAPFVDGLTGRRTSAFAAASTGARLLSSRGPLFDPAFETAPFALASTKDEFCEQAHALFQTSDRPGQRRQRIEWYDRHLASENLDRHLLAILLRHL